MQGYRRKSRRDTGRREVWGYKTEVEERIERWERLALRYKVKKEEALESCRDRNENAFARPNRLCEKNAKKLRFRAGELDLPDRRKRYTSSREEEEEDAQTCPCGKVIDDSIVELT